MNLLQFLKPINTDQEAEKFFSSSTYNPQFIYDWDTGAINEWLDLPNQKKYTHFVDAILSQDQAQIDSESKKIFSTEIDESLLRQAKEIVSHSRRELKSQTFNDLVESYERAFRYFDIDYSIIVSDEKGFAARPSHTDKTLTLNQHISLTYNSVEGLTRHELLHIIRSINSTHNKIEISDNYLPTEEGLACYFQNIKGTEQNFSLFQHASRYVATDIALNGSFRDVTDYLRSIGFEKKLAYRRAIRHKSGFRDTSQPGDNMKSSMYFYNLERVRKLSDDEIIRLLVGKIAVEDLKDYSEYKGKIPENKIKEYFDLST